MDIHLNISYPLLKCAVAVFSSLKMSNSESHIQYFDCVECSIFTGGSGTLEAFDLSLDRLTIILNIKGLPDATQMELLKRFDRFDVNFDDLQGFLDTLFTASFTSKSKIIKISKPKKLSKKQVKQPKSDVNPVAPSTNAARAANPSSVVKDVKCSP